MITVPIFLDTPLFTERVTLSGSDYVLTFDWNGRAERWFFSLADIDGNVIAGAQKIVIGTDLLRHMRWNDAIPTGTLFALDTQNNDAAPLLNELGRRVLLVYDDGT